MVAQVRDEVEGTDTGHDHDRCRDALALRLANPEDGRGLDECPQATALDRVREPALIVVADDEDA